MTKDEFFLSCKKNGLELTITQLSQLDKYFHMLVEKNKVMNLTAIIEEEDVYEKHFFDSLFFSFDLDLNDKSLIDIGTGAGFPGMVVAICYPNLNVYLLETLTKRCLFLKEVVEALILNNVVIINSRSEDYVKEHREFFDYATARAVSRLNILLEIIIPCVKVKGLFIALKGKIALEELEEAKNAMNKLNLKINHIQKGNLFANDDTRINLFIEKMKVTDNHYPRQFGQIKKKPL